MIALLFLKMLFCIIVYIFAYMTFDLLLMQQLIKFIGYLLKGPVSIDWQMVVCPSILVLSCVQEKNGI